MHTVVSRKTNSEHKSTLVKKGFFLLLKNSKFGTANCFTFQCIFSLKNCFPWKKKCQCFNTGTQFLVHFYACCDTCMHVIWKASQEQFLDVPLFPNTLIFSWRITHYGTIGNVSLPAASATGGRQALNHSWTHHTLMCGTNAKNSAVGLLIVKWIQLLLVFNWGLQPPQRVINLDPVS